MDLTRSMKKAKKKANKFRLKVLSKENIIFAEEPTCFLILGNCGLANGVSPEGLLQLLRKFNAVDVFMPPGKSYSFSVFPSPGHALSARNELYNSDHSVFRYPRLVQSLTCHQNEMILFVDFVRSMPESYCKSSAFQNERPKGLILLEDIISESEELLLLKSVKCDNCDDKADCDKWIVQRECEDDFVDTGCTASLKNREVSHYGYEFLYGSNDIDKGNPMELKIPEECKAILQRIANKTDYGKHCDQLTVNIYNPGQGIPSHIDTHSAFEDGILSVSLLSDIVMDFHHKDGRNFALLLPRRSALIMTGESRYAWMHGITPRKSDVITLDPLSKVSCGSSSLSPIIALKIRKKRISLTFRTVLQSDCCCNYPECCNREKPNGVPERKKNRDERLMRLEESINKNTELESIHVHDVYEKIAAHFSLTRHMPWPKVRRFIEGLDVGCLLADVGSGNGKYLGINPQVCKVGCDRSTRLCRISSERGHEIVIADCCEIPYRDNLFDAVISIAVLHHLSTVQRRRRMLSELIRITCPLGKILISVWAQNQADSSYLQKGKEASADVSTISNLPVHTNRTNFSSQDILVPWKEKDSQEVYHRFYHVFVKGELEELCAGFGVGIESSYHDNGNWCVILQKNAK